MPTKKNLPPLKSLGDLLVLGGRFRFGRGSTKSGHPLLYISIPHRPGLSVLMENLPAFHKHLGEMIKKGFPELRGEPTPTPEKAPETARPEKPAPPTRPCPGPASEDWRYIHKIQGGLEGSPELFVAHEFAPTKENGTACATCTYDTARRDYGAIASELRKGEEGDPPDEEPPSLPPGAPTGGSPQFPGV